MQAIRVRTMIVTASFVSLGLLSACSKQPAPSANTADAMSTTDNGGSMAAGNTMGGSMRASDSMQKNSH